MPIVFLLITLLLAVLIFLFISAFRSKGIIKLIPAAVLFCIELYVVIIFPKKDPWGDIAATIYSIPIIILLLSSLIMAAKVKPYKSKTEEIKICPKCKSEYRKEFEKCSDCDVLLESYTKDKI